MLVVAAMQFFKVDARGLSREKRSTHIAASSYMRFISQPNLKMDKRSIIKTRSLGLKKCAFNCDLSFFFIMVCNLMLCRLNTVGNF